MSPMTKIVENAEKALKEVELLYQRGFVMEDIYVLAHNAEVTHKLAALANTKEIGVAEEGVFQSLANVIRSRGDELRSKLESLGVPEGEAIQVERQLDQGHVAIINTSEVQGLV
jgi:Fe2+ transport system protein FeoA